MTREMISGPDLGGGYLHQLSVDRDGETSSFVFHSQDGGADANGPPKGPLDRFGFVRPGIPCSLGGPRCWERRFLLPFTETPRVRAAYNRYRFALETMMAQAYDGVPAAVDAALREVVHRLAADLARDGTPWWVGGSAAVWLLGADLVPNDIDLGTSRVGVDRIAPLLAEYLIEPLATTDWPPGRIVRGARAFVGTLRDGARVEWGVPLDPSGEGEAGEWTVPPGAPPALTASFDGVEVRVSRPEYSLVRAASRGDSGRATAIAKVVERVGPDPVLLRQLIERSSDPSAVRSSLSHLIPIEPG